MVLVTVSNVFSDRKSASSRHSLELLPVTNYLQLELSCPSAVWVGSAIVLAVLTLCPLRFVARSLSSRHHFIRLGPWRSTGIRRERRRGEDVRRFSAMYALNPDRLSKMLVFTFAFRR